MSDWRSISEILAGAAYKYRFCPDEKYLKVPISLVNPDTFYPPINDFIKAVKDTNKTKEDIVMQYPDTFQAAKFAVESLNGLSNSNINWIDVLAKRASEYGASIQLRKISDQLENGDDVDWSKVAGIAKRAQLQQNVNAYTPLSEIERMKIPFVKTGWDAVDTHLGGIPSFGLIILEGYPKSGKTTAIAKLAGCFAKTHPDKKVAVHTYEMIQEELAMRFDEIEVLPEEIQTRILLRDVPENAEQAVSIAATEDDLGLMIVDFADFMIQGETNESTMSHIYRTISTGAKQLRVPIILIAQLSGSRGGIPRPQDIRYTRLAEAFSSMVLAIYNPHTQKHYDNPDAELLPIMKNAAYLVCWLVRGGFRMHKEDSPGAIAIGWNGGRGWGDKGKWFAIRE